MAELQVLWRSLLHLRYPLLVVLIHGSTYKFAKPRGSRKQYRGPIRKRKQTEKRDWNRFNHLQSSTQKEIKTSHKQCTKNVVSLDIKQPSPLQISDPLSRKEGKIQLEYPHRQTKMASSTPMEQKGRHSKQPVLLSLYQRGHFKAPR